MSFSSPSSSSEHNQESQQLQGFPLYDAEVVYNDDQHHPRNQSNTAAPDPGIQASQQSVEISSEEEDDDDDDLTPARPPARSVKRSLGATEDYDSSSSDDETLTIHFHKPTASPIAKKVKMSRVAAVPMTNVTQKKKSKEEIAAIAEDATNKYESNYALYASTHDKYNAAKKREHAANKEISALENKNASLQKRLAKAEQSAFDRRGEIESLRESLGSCKKRLTEQTSLNQRLQKQVSDLDTKYSALVLKHNKTKQDSIIAIEVQKTKAKEREAKIKNAAAAQSLENLEMKHQMSLELFANKERLKLNAKAAELEHKANLKKLRFHGMWGSGISNLVASIAHEPLAQRFFGGMPVFDDSMIENNPTNSFPNEYSHQLQHAHDASSSYAPPHRQTQPGYHVYPHPALEANYTQRSPQRAPSQDYAASHETAWTQQRAAAHRRPSSETPMYRAPQRHQYMPAAATATNNYDVPPIQYGNSMPNYRQPMQHAPAANFYHQPIQQHVQMPSYAVDQDEPQQVPSCDVAPPAPNQNLLPGAAYPEGQNIQYHQHEANR